MEDSEALAECVKLSLEDWLNRGGLVGQIHLLLRPWRLDLQDGKVWVEFEARVVLNLAEKSETE